MPDEPPTGRPPSGATPDPAPPQQTGGKGRSGRKGGDDSGWGNVGVGLQMLVGTALGFFVGNWLDGRFGWSPWGVLVGTMLGLAAGMYLLIKDAIRINKE